MSAGTALASSEASEVRHAYVDFGAVRIQSYLTRTAGLRGHRAASGALARATSNEVIQEVVGHLADINEEAGEADGVISLSFPVVPGTDVEARVTRLQDQVLDHLRRALPGAEFQSVWGLGASYLETYATEFSAKTRRGEIRFDLPPVAEFPLAEPCRMCHTDPAAGREHVVDGREALCPDCSMRNVSRYVTLADEKSPEGRLRFALGLEEGPANFVELAALGTPASGRNHLATVAIDGNAFGEFFKALAVDGASDPLLTSQKQHLSQQLSQATRDALEQATLELPLTLETGQLCVIPHVVGGDDVLVTLPAEQAWPFVLHFLGEFGNQVREKTQGVVDRLNEHRSRRPGVPPLVVPTASAGVVFSHHRYPLHLLVESAHELLRDAKRSVGGREASVQWTDITTDGSGRPAHDPVRLSDLVKADGSPTLLAGRLSRLTNVPAAHRATLAEALRSSGPITAAVIASRNTHLPHILPFLPPFDRPGDRPSGGMGLGAALGLARWWPCA